MRTHEADLCIVGAGITGTMLAAKLAAERQLSIVVVEAGEKLFDLDKRFEHRQRYLDYRENSWPGDFIEDQGAEGIISRTMAVGGQALHWAATSLRYSREDFRIRSLYGVGWDWPVSYEELEPYYCEAERRIGVAGSQGPESEGWDPRSEPYPMEAFPLDYNQRHLRDWASKADIEFRVTPTARNTRPYDGRMQCMRCGTCNICPTGAKYSPDFTLKTLLDERAIELVPNTLVRRLELDGKGRHVQRAVAVDRTSGEELEIRARAFALAGGYTWTPHLMMLSANSRSPNGLANSSGLVGRYMCGHRPMWALIEVPHRIYPGLSLSSMITRRFMKPPPGNPYIRHDLALFTHTYGRQPRLRDDGGRLLLGDNLMADWRQRSERGCARVRGYYDVLPAKESRVVLDPATRNRWGDPLPGVEHVEHETSRSLRDQTHQQLMGIFERLVARGRGKILETFVGEYLDHPSGGCRMGDDPSESVCDGTGRTHDHENLWIIGAPTCVSSGCVNSTLTFVALSLRTATFLGKEFPRRS